MTKIALMLAGLVAAGLLILVMRSDIGGPRHTRTQPAPEPAASASPAPADCEYATRTICHDGYSSPRELFAYTDVLASVIVEAVDPPFFNTASGAAPDAVFDPDYDPELEREATLEAVVLANEGPDAMDAEWSESTYATVDALDEQHEARLDAWSAYEPGRLAVLRLTDHPGVLLGESDMAYAVTYLPGGRAVIGEGPSAGCVIEHQVSCVPSPSEGEQGIASLAPYHDVEIARSHGIRHCQARAEALQLEHGLPARCVRLVRFLPELSPETYGWYLDGASRLRLDEIMDQLEP